MSFPKEFLEIIERFGSREEVRAMTLGGSVGAGKADDKSDFDVYIYQTAMIPLSFRSAVAEETGYDANLNMRFFETGDEWFISGIDIMIDIMYRDPNWMENEITRVYEHFEASVGYSTCFLHNLVESFVLFDPDGWYGQLRARVGNYPEGLKKSIVEKNHGVLRGIHGSFFGQLSSAVYRGDFISCTHRTAALLAGVFDILFAINGVFHPGEKRMLSYALEKCSKLPENFESDLLVLTESLQGDCKKLLLAAESICEHLDELLKNEGYL